MDGGAGGEELIAPLTNTSADVSLVTILGAIGVGSVLSSLVTGFFLRAQSRRQDLREERRLSSERDQREADRKAEDDRRAIERRQILDDHWRGERRQAHVLCLGLMQKSLHELDNAYWHAPPDEWLSDTLSSPALAGAVANVELLGSEATWARMTEAVAALQTYEAWLRVHGVEDMDVDIEESRPAHGERAARKAIAAYREAVRRELGTSNSRT